MTDQIDKLLRPKAVTTLLGISKSTLSKMKNLTKVNITGRQGGAVGYFESEVMALLDKNKQISNQSVSALIYDPNYAGNFNSVDQYRTALLSAINNK